MKTSYLLGLPFATIKVNGRMIEAMVDTGFNGAVLLPASLVSELNLIEIGFVQYAMLIKKKYQ